MARHALVNNLHFKPDSFPHDFARWPLKTWTWLLMLWFLPISDKNMERIGRFLCDLQKQGPFLDIRNKTVHASTVLLG